MEKKEKKLKYSTRSTRMTNERHEKMTSGLRKEPAKKTVEKEPTMSGVAKSIIFPEKSKEIQTKGNQKTIEYAGLLRRIGAFFIDDILLVFLIWFISSLSGLITENWLVLIVLILVFLYFSYLESSEKQATFGKQALGIVVTDVHGQRISFRHSIGRTIVKLFLFGIIGLFTNPTYPSSSMVAAIVFSPIIFTKKKQGLHDIATGTLVVRREKKDKLNGTKND